MLIKFPKPKNMFLRFSIGQETGCFTHLSWVVALVFLLGILTIIESSSVLPVQAAPPSSIASIPPGYSSEIIHVKFREGTKVNSAGEPLPQDLRNSAAGLTRLFSLPEEKLNKIRDKGVKRSAKKLPNLNLWFQITLKPGTDAGKFIETLKRLDSVEIAEPAPLPAPLPAITPDFTESQGYLNAAGIEARYAWTFPGGNGSGVTIYDVEYSWNQTHEDLRKVEDVPLLLNDGDSAVDPFNDNNHGTAVLGELIGDNDTKGVTGISWGADIGMAPANTKAGYNPANAILLAVADGSTGDVILIEQQTGVCNLCGESDCTDRIDNDGDNSVDEGLFGPLEWSSPVFDAIQHATENGFIVVEAAGNGGVDLDQPACLGRFDRNEQDSGAIIVGAGGSPGSGFDRQRLGFSSYGSRVDLQGWGNGVMTTGYGFSYMDPDDPNNPNFWYTDTFNGTSSASPIVAGAVANLQGISLNRSGTPFTPDEVRTLLVETGSPQLGDTSEHIGPRPNLWQAIVRRFFKTIYLPVMVKQFTVAPDLVVDCITGTSLSLPVSLGGGPCRSPSSPIEVTIRNQGSASVIDSFWVDLCFDPNPIPTGVNQICDDGRSTYHLIWGVTKAALPLTPGNTLILTLNKNDPYFKSSLSNLPASLLPNTVIYAQVDSANINTTYGSVLENHEINGGPYNNIINTVPLTFTPVTAGVNSSEGEDQPVLAGNLPPRP